MTYQEAQRYFSIVYQWHLHEETFQRLSDHHFAVKVTTLFHKKSGEDEATFFIIYESTTRMYVVFNTQEPLTSLAQWCLEQTEKGD